jgi:hypothetical protein
MSQLGTGLGSRKADLPDDPAYARRRQPGAHNMPPDAFFRAGTIIRNDSKAAHKITAMTPPMPGQ